MLVATKSVYVDVDGARHKLRRGRTTAEVGAVVVAEHPDLWEPLVPDFPATAEPPDSPPATRPAAAAGKPVWAAYVAELGGAVDGLTKDQLISLADQLED